MASSSYRCPKCDHRSFESGEIRAAGGFWSKFFNVEGQRFTTVICRHCRYTELFHSDSSRLGNVFDFFGN